MPIPLRDLAGLLPPFVGATPTVPADLSPYSASMMECVQSLVVSQATADIMRGVIEFREALAAFGLTGFQWIAGSFVEDCIAIRGRDPADADLVTFFWRPAQAADDASWASFCGNNPALLDLFDPRQAKAAYKCDAYPVDLHLPPDYIVAQVSYWSSLFGHQRTTRVWKGMVVVSMDTAGDAAARTEIDRLFP